MPFSASFHNLLFDWADQPKGTGCNLDCSFVLWSLVVQYETLRILLHPHDDQLDIQFGFVYLLLGIYWMVRFQLLNKKDVQ